MELKPGQRVCFCYKDGVHLAQIFAGASKRLLGEFIHPQDLTNDDLEKFIKMKAAEHGLTAVKAPYVGCNFYIKALQS
jgi:hypothetical protein